jgi:hypothetical protein
MKASFVGRWRIVEMELWDQKFVDLESPGHITFNRPLLFDLPGQRRVMLQKRLSEAHSFSDA